MKPHPVDSTALRTTLEARPEVLFAYLFGSCATGDITPLSDVDIAIYTAPETGGYDKKLELWHGLSTALKTEKLDLVLLNSAPVSLVFRVLQKRTLLLDRDPLKRHAFESLMMRKYFDFSDMEKKILERRFDTKQPETLHG